MADKDKKELKVIKPWDDSVKEDHAGRVGGMRNLIEIEVETDDGYLFSYLVKKPGRKEVQAITNAAAKKEINLVQKLTIGCVLEGDKDTYENDGAVYLQLIARIGELVETARSSVKKK